MSKFPKILSKKEHENLFIEFAQALATLRSPAEMAQFIKDLLSEQETTMLARRLQIAKLLYKGLTYEEIKDLLKVSFGTVARVQTWMQIYGEGYRTVLERTKSKEDSDKKLSDWGKIKRRYPAYFWPQLLLNEIIKSADKKQKRRLLEVLGQLKEKTSLSKQLEQILKHSTD